MNAKPGESDSVAIYPTLKDFATSEAIGFSLDSPAGFYAAVDKIVLRLGASVDLLGIGEPMHGGEAFLILRNKLFERLVESHAFTAIAVESSYPRGWAANQFLLDDAQSDFASIRTTGFSHGFGALDANLELLQWIKKYNQSHSKKVHFHGFDAPMEMTGAESPRQLIGAAMDYLESIDGPSARRGQIESLIAPEPDWNNPAAAFDPSKSIGSSPNTATLQRLVNELRTDLLLRQPELVDRTGEVKFADAVHAVESALHLLSYHVVMSQSSADRVQKLLGIRDRMMAETLHHIVQMEKIRGGKVLAFAHNTHLQRGSAHWQLGPMNLNWWPAGAHLDQMLRERYAVIGAGVVVSEANGIGAPEAGTIEHALADAPGPARFALTSRGRCIAKEVLKSIPTRTGGKNPTYFPLTSRSMSDFDALVVLDQTQYARGGPPVPT